MTAHPHGSDQPRLLIVELPEGVDPEVDTHQGAQRRRPLGRVFGPLEALGVEIVAVSSAAEARKRLEDEVFDVLVVDAKTFGDAKMFGQGQLRAPQGAPKRRTTAVLLVADPADPIPAVVAGRALKGSVWDLVHRDAPPEELLLRTDHLIEESRVREDLERARYHASHDDRTGLLRPARFEARLREHFSAAQRHRLELALVLVDMDDFGQVNKRYDHMVGDELIMRAGSVIRMSLRTEDVGARIGGDEFALILPYTQRVDAARVVSRLAGRFRALSGPAPHRSPAAGDADRAVISVSASIGFETFDGSDLGSPEELRQHAEMALRAAKERGGSQGVYFRSLSRAEALPAVVLAPQPPAESPALDPANDLANGPIAGTTTGPAAGNRRPSGPASDESSWRDPGRNLRRDPLPE